MKSFVSLPPADFYVLDQEVVYTIPYTQVVQGRATSSYQLISDFQLSSSGCQMLTPHDHEKQFQLMSTAYPLSSIAGFTLHQETVSNSPFLLRHDAVFSDVEVHTRIRQVFNVYDSQTWTWDFREVLILPQTNHDYRDPFLYFSHPPQYQVTLFPPANVTIACIQDFLTIALPTSLNQYAPRFA